MLGTYQIKQFVERVATALTDPVPYLHHDALGFDVLSCLLLVHYTNTVSTVTNKQKMEKLKLTLIQFPATSHEVHILNAHKLGAFDNLPAKIKYQEDRQADIRRDEGIDVPRARQEHLESVEENDEVDPKYAKVAGVRLQGRLVR